MALAIALFGCSRTPGVREPEARDRLPRLASLRCEGVEGGSGGPGGAWWNPIGFECTARIESLRAYRTVVLELRVEEGGDTDIVGAHYAEVGDRDSMDITIRFPIASIEPLGHYSVMADPGAAAYRLTFHATIDVSRRAGDENVRLEFVDRRSTTMWIAFGE